MSKKRMILVASLIILIFAATALLVSSVFKSTPVPEPVVESVELQTTEPAAENETAEVVLEPLPIDNKKAIESEITNIEKEINSAMETELDDLSDIELSL